MSDTCSFSIKYECEDSSFSGSSTSNFIQDKEQFDANHSDSLTQIKTTDGKETSIYLSTGNKLLFTSGKYFYIDHTIAYTEYQKECTGIVGICHTCGGKIKGSLKVSSNFICHLKTKHPDIYQDFIRRKNDYTATSIKLSKKNHNNRTTLCPSITDTQNAEKQQQFHHKILQFLITTNLSFDTVQRPAFLELFSYADIAIEIHPSNYYEKLVKDTCDYKRMELFQIFNASTLYFCCTLDVWNYNGFYYIAISAHWVDDELRRQSALLACKKCVENLACLENLYHLYSAAMTQYGIAPTQIVACTTLNMQNYFDDFGELNLGKDVFQNTCNPQLNDVAEKLTFLSNPDAFHVNAFMLDIIKLNKIWGGNFFRKLNSCGKSLHSSSMEKCCNIWRIYMSKEQTDVVMSFLGEPLVKPCLYSVTSLYAAIKQLLNSKEQLKDISKCLNVPCLSNQEIDYLQEFLLVYEPMAMAFEFLDMTQNHYYGCFLPTLVTIKWKLIRLYNSKKLCHLQDALQQLREDLQMDFKDYYNLDGSKSDSIMAALTYPPVKTRFLSGLKDNIYCLSFHPRNMLLKYGKEYHKRDDNFHNQYTSLVNISSAECEVTEFFDFGDSTDSAAENGNLPQSLKMEIDSYLADPDGSLKSLQKYPTVRRMFYRYNTCIPSPSSVSRIFPVTELLRTSLSSPWEEEQFENNFFYSHYYVNKNRM